MACNCQNRRKRDLTYVRTMALKQSQIDQLEMQIYRKYLEPIGWIYDYEPIDKSRTDIVEYVKY